VLSFAAMRTNTSKKVRPSKEQVRAWLTTVIAPMASALAIESERVKRGNWSFRCETRDFEFLWPVPKMIAVPYVPNLEQLLRFRNDLKTLVHAHDGALADLLIAAGDLYEKVLQSERFQSLAASISVAESDRKYLAEYIVNGVRDLPSHYVHYELWVREGGRFLDLREAPGLVTEVRGLLLAGRRFAGRVDSLLESVNGLQVGLADKYKLPPVDPTDIVRI
jgi:hypothetical protein